MDAIHSAAPLWACLASLLAVVPIVALGRWPNLREGATFLAAGAKFAIVASMLPLVLDGKVIEFTLFQAAPNAALAFRVDAFGIFFALIASILWIPTTLYAIGYMRGLGEHSQTRFFAFFAVSLSATLGVAFAANLLTLYIFYEMLSLATFPLVVPPRRQGILPGARFYLGHLLGTSVGFALPALIYCYVKTGGGSLDFSLDGFLAGHVSRGESVALLLLFAFGFSKAGLMPFHSWLPNAMVAPTPVSALLHAVAVVKVGVFCIVRVVTGVFGVDLLDEFDLGAVLGWVAAFTVIVSSLIALSQDNLKRRLAFSTIGQLAYIVLGIALLTPMGVKGSILHIGAHAFGKITLFFCAGAIFVATGKKYISQMAGLGKAMPVTFAAFFIGSLSVIGLPPTGGFLSKFQLVLGTMEAHQIGLLVVYLVSTVLNAAYFLPIVFRAFFPPAGAGAAPFSWRNVKEAPVACVAPICFTALCAIALFFFPAIGQKLAAMMVAAP
ncbi:MAG: monovalent cation/H+ antiporter subunit D family protein [Verrucomicrobiales bacterium]